MNHGASPLVLDQTLADQAQQWADKKVFKHSPWAGGQGGETIALGSLYPTFTAAVKAWHDEEKDYDWSTGTGNRDMKISHFTQVWLQKHFYIYDYLILKSNLFYWDAITANLKSSRSCSRELGVSMWQWENEPRDTGARIW